MRIRNNAAFTVVEIIVVVTVIAVLSSLAIVTYSNVRQGSRDAARKTNATIISEALEKYYEKNGEYPSVASIVNDDPANTGTAVASKLSITPNTLVMPLTPTGLTNAITPGPDPGDDDDTIAYVAASGADNDQCQNDPNGGCDLFTLKYIEESTGETKVIESRHKTRVEAGIDAPQLSLSGVTNTSIKATWTDVGTGSYLLQRSLTSDFSSVVSTNQASTTFNATGLTPNTEYFFRVRAVAANGSVSDWSPTQSETTGSLTPPTGITISAAMSGTNARGTAGGGTCSGGATIERQIRYHATNTSTDGAWQAWTTGSPRDVAASEGYKYTFQSQARCTLNGATSPWAQSGTASTFRPITTAPTTPTLTTSTSSSAGTVTWNWTMTCPAGTTKEYLTRRTSSESGYDSGWSSTPSTTSTYTWSNAEGYNLTLQVQGRCSTPYSSTSYVTSATKSAVAPIRAPAAPTNFVYFLRQDRYWDQWTWSNPSCGTGTRPEFYFNSYLSGAGWYWVETGQEGWRYGTGWSPSRQYMSSPLYGTNNNPAYPHDSSNIRVQHKAYYQCVNTTTGRISAAGPVGTSALTTVPSW